LFPQPVPAPRIATTPKARTMPLTEEKLGENVSISDSPPRHKAINAENIDF